VDGKVVAAMRRQNTKDEFSSNLYGDDSAEVVKLSKY
jgi:hypothetical protein